MKSGHLTAIVINSKKVEDTTQENCKAEKENKEIKNSTPTPRQKLTISTSTQGFRFKTVWINVCSLNKQKTMDLHAMILRHQFDITVFCESFHGGTGLVSLVIPSRCQAMGKVRLGYRKSWRKTAK